MEAIKQNRQKAQESKHFTSLQIFTSYAEPSLDEYLSRKDQQVIKRCPAKKPASVNPNI